MKTNHIYKVLLTSLALILLGLSCADAEHVQHVMTGHTYGFWGGLWHGMIAFFSLVGSLFSDEITVYALNNNGGWYDFGFCLGAGILFGGSSHTTKLTK